MKQKTYKKPSRGPNQLRQRWSVENFFRLGPDHDPPSVAQLFQEVTSNGFSHLFSTPKIRRLSMVPSPIDRNPLRRLWRRICCGAKSRTTRQQSDAVSTGARTGQSQYARWRRAARFRRIGLLILITLQTLAASWSLTNTFPYPWLKGSEIAIIGMFAVLFSWISFGFWTAVAGFWMLLRRVKEFTVADLCSEQEDPRPLQSRTAVLMPICNENVARVFAGLEASYRSLAATSELRQFDFYVLSDTSNPETQVEEEIAWAQTCRAVQGFGKIFYRHRRNNIRRKSGNIADFLRRWGRNYDYMIVFDADSVMAGTTLVRLVEIMDLILKRASFRPLPQPSIATHFSAGSSNSPAAPTVPCLPPDCASGNWAKVTIGDITRSFVLLPSSSTAALPGCPANHRWVRKSLVTISSKRP